MAKKGRIGFFIFTILILSTILLAVSQISAKKYEVFCINGVPQAYMPYGYWDPILRELNVVKASYKQLEEAQAAGAEWCSAGFMDDDSCAWPRQTALQGCGTPPITKWCPDGKKGSLTVYGLKPAKNKANTSKYEILPFNSTKWSMYDS